MRKMIAKLGRFYFGLYHDRRLIEMEKRRNGEREPITGYYKGCPVDHVERRIFIEKGTMVQCLKCMKVFDRDVEQRAEWAGSLWAEPTVGVGLVEAAAPFWANAQAVVQSLQGHITQAQGAEAVHHFNDPDVVAASAWDIFDPTDPPNQ